MLKLRDHNGTPFKPTTVAVSTVELPYDQGYETAIVTETGVEPIERYHCCVEAVSGHVRSRKKYLGY